MREATVPAVWDEEVPAVEDVPADRIRAAVEKARDAFWAAIGEAFPEVTTGDMAPGDDLALEWATNDTVLTWLRYNHPSAVAAFQAAMEEADA